MEHQKLENPTDVGDNSRRTMGSWAALALVMLLWSGEIHVYVRVCQSAFVMDNDAWTTFMNGKQKKHNKSKSTMKSVTMIQLRSKYFHLILNKLNKGT